MTTSLEFDPLASHADPYPIYRHSCLGASLARLEARVAFEALVPELLRLERAESTSARVDSFLVRGPKRLAVQRAA